MTVCLVHTLTALQQLFQRLAHVGHGLVLPKRRLDRSLVLAQPRQKLLFVKTCQVQVLSDHGSWCLREPLFCRKVLEFGRLEHLQHLNRLITDILNVMCVVLWHNTDVASHVVERSCNTGSCKDGYPRVALEEETPFVCIWMPMHLTKTARHDGNVSSRCGLGHRKVTGVGDTDFTTWELDGLLFEHTVSEARLGWTNYFAVIFQRTGQSALKDVLFVVGEGVEDTFIDAKVLAEHRLWRLGHVVCEQESAVFGEVSIIEDEQELDTLVAGS